MTERDQTVFVEALHLPVLICQILFLEVSRNVGDDMAGKQSRVPKRRRASSGIGGMRQTAVWTRMSAHSRRSTELRMSIGDASSMREHVVSVPALLEEAM